MFDQDRFIQDCSEALASGGQRGVREVMARTVNDPAGIIAALGEPSSCGADVLHRSAALTVLNIVWGPNFTVSPHNHHTWAVIGIYTGREDNIFWRVLPPDARWPIEAAGASSLMPRDACALGKDIIHSVTNPLGRLTSALHVYGGDFLAQEREEWDEENLACRSFDWDRARDRFERANRALQAPG